MSNISRKNIYEYLEKYETVFSRKQADKIQLASEIFARINKKIVNLLVILCNQKNEKHHKDLFLNEFGMTDGESTAALCIAETLSRIPDEKTSELFINDHVIHKNWIQDIENISNASDDSTIRSLFAQSIRHGTNNQRSSGENLHGRDKKFQTLLPPSISHTL